MKKLVLGCAVTALASCGDQANAPVDGASNPDSGTVDAAPIDSALADAAPFVAPTPFSVAPLVDGPDQLQSATAGPGTSFFAAGFRGPVGGPYNVFFVKLDDGAVDATFGSSGIVTTSMVAPGGADDIDIATQPDGKIVIAATVVDANNASDRNIAVQRFLATGQLDTTFGSYGTRLLNFSQIGDGSTVTDAQRGLDVDASGNLFLHAVKRASGVIAGPKTPRVDSDFAVIKLTANGALDSNFGDGGVHALDLFIGGHSNATPRGIDVLSDGTILAGGYSNAIGTTQAVLYKLSASGALVNGFADGGIFHDTVLATQTEIYGFAVHGNHAVTAGYGRESGTANDWVSMRFDITSGARDTAWGGTANGAVVFDPSMAMLGSNCRNALGLPDGATLLLGSNGPSQMAEQDATFAVLDANGVLDTRFGTGIVEYQLGANGNDQFWGAARNGDRVLIVGYKGGLAALGSQTLAVNDDAYAVELVLP